VIVDTSALVAVLFAEPDAEHYERAIASASSCRMSAANFLEAAIVLESRAGASSAHELDLALERGRIMLEPVTPDQAHAARRAWQRLGKGNHPAALNFGDCFAYALAETTQEPLLFKGDDFALTDVQAA
jgi:ribonuclease VapC